MKLLVIASTEMASGDDKGVLFNRYMGAIYYI